MRLACERSLYNHLRAHRQDLPELSDDVDTELDDEPHSSVLFEHLEERGIFNELWGDNRRGDADEHMLQLPTRRDMWDLIRDLGYACVSTPQLVQEGDRGRWSRVVWYPRDLVVAAHLGGR